MEFLLKSLPTFCRDSIFPFLPPSTLFPPSPLPPSLPPSLPPPLKPFFNIEHLFFEGGGGNRLEEYDTVP